MRPLPIDSSFNDAYSLYADNGQLVYAEKYKRHWEYYKTLHNATDYRCSPIVRDDNGVRTHIHTFFSASYAASYIQQQGVRSRAELNALSHLKLSADVKELKLLIKQRSMNGVQSDDAIKKNKRKYRFLTRKPAGTAATKVIGRPRGRPRKEATDRPSDGTDRVDNEA